MQPEWQKTDGKLAEDQRLVPKIPFVIGGEYSIVKFYASTYPKISIVLRRFGQAAA